MLEVATVEKIHGKKATLVVERSTACGECGKCMMAKQNITIACEVENTLDAKLGDKVRVEMELSGVLSASLIVYGIPLTTFILGVVLGYYKIYQFFNIPQDIISLILGFVFMATTYVILRLFDKKGVFKERYQLKMLDLVQ